MPIVTDWSRWCSSRMVFDLSSESGVEYRPSLLETLVNPPCQCVAIAGQPEGYRPIVVWWSLEKRCWVHPCLLPQDQTTSLDESTSPPRLSTGLLILGYTLTLLAIILSLEPTQNLRRIKTIDGCTSRHVCVEAREGIAMVIWRYVVLLVFSILILSTLAASIILASQKNCFDILVGPHGFTIHVDPQCGGSKD